MNSQRDLFELIVTVFVLVACVAMIVTGHDSGSNASIISSGFTGILTYWFTRSGVALGQSQPTPAPVINPSDVQTAVQTVLNMQAQIPAQNTGVNNGQSNIQSNGVR